MRTTMWCHRGSVWPARPGPAPLSFHAQKSKRTVVGTAACIHVGRQLRPSEAAAARPAPRARHLVVPLVVCATARTASCALIRHRPLWPWTNVEDEDEKVAAVWYDKISEQEVDDEGKEDISSTSLLKLTNE